VTQGPWVLHPSTQRLEFTVTGNGHYYYVEPTKHNGKYRILTTDGSDTSDGSPGAGRNIGRLRAFETANERTTCGVAGTGEYSAKGSGTCRAMACGRKGGSQERKEGRFARLKSALELSSARVRSNPSEDRISDANSSASHPRLG